MLSILRELELTRMSLTLLGFGTSGSGFLAAFSMGHGLITLVIHGLGLGFWLGLFLGSFLSKILDRSRLLN
jgi:hypothetical protein